MHPDDKLMMTDAFYELMKITLRQKDHHAKMMMIDHLNDAFRWYLALVDELEMPPFGICLSDDIDKESK